MTPSQQIEQLIAQTTDWRGKTLAAVRECFLAADANITEEWKWKGSPTWYCDGIIAVANAHKEKVKVTFTHGASLDDPDKLFNAGLDGKVWRAIDFLEGDKVNVNELTALIRTACERNQKKDDSLKRKK
jgi:hypothetical protein